MDNFSSYWLVLIDKCLWISCHSDLHFYTITSFSIKWVGSLYVCPSWTLSSVWPLSEDEQLCSSICRRWLIASVPWSPQTLPWSTGPWSDSAISGCETKVWLRFVGTCGEVGTEIWPCDQVWFCGIRGCGTCGICSIRPVRGDVPVVFRCRESILARALLTVASFMFDKSFAHGVWAEIFGLNELRNVVKWFAELKDLCRVAKVLCFSWWGLRYGLVAAFVPSAKH